MKENPMQMIGQRIREARRARQLSQKELAERTGWLGSTRISNYEQGTREPGREEITALAHALGCPPLWLGGYDLMMTPDERALWYKYWGTDERGRLQIHSIADAQPAKQAGDRLLLLSHTG